MAKFTVILTVEAPSLVSAVTGILFPDGEPAEGILTISAEEKTS